ncbi:MAG: ABC transporter permease [Treponema sp.]|nr:ABC transporter permease [Treponema sp.]
MLEDFLDALQSFRRNRMRTFLSLLGIIIGVASVIVIMSLGQSSTQKIKDTFGSAGLDMVSLSGGFFRRSRAAVTLSFDEPFREKLFGSIGGIRKIWYKNSLSATISYGETSSNASCSAVETDYMQACGIQLESGRFFDVTDDVKGTQKIILGSAIASTLFPNGDAVGKRVMLVASNAPFSFTVIGVLKEQSSGMENTSQGCYIPRGFYSRKIKPNPAADTVMVQAENETLAVSLSSKLEEYCNNLTGTEGSVYASSMQSMIEQLGSITSVLSLLLAVVAGISLLVGGIGIMNIMIVTVTERKQEIGIRKALGASPALIRRQFLVESASITLMGGLLGIVLGIAISIAAEYVQSAKSFVVSWTACLVAFVFSLFVGIFFGLSPASRAARLDPVEALSGE